MVGTVAMVLCWLVFVGGTVLAVVDAGRNMPAPRRKHRWTGII